MATVADVVERFIKLFRGRGDALGSWTGGAIRRPVTAQDFHDHLGDGPHYGSYPLIGDRCSFGCIDIDGKDFNHNWDAMWALARNLQVVLDVKSVPAHLEQTAHGIHVWVFPEDPLVPARAMRRALMAACTAIGYAPKEVNPKQESVNGAQLGNYIRMAYNGGLRDDWKPTERFFVDEQGAPLHVVDFLPVAEANKASLDALEAIAQLWSPPVADVQIDVNAGLDVQPLVSKLPGLAYTVWKDGPLPGSDRSGTLIRFAHMVADSGQFTPSDCFQLVASADLRWGKFHGRTDCDQQLSNIVERAYSQ